MRETSVETLMLAAAWSSPLDRRYTIMDQLPTATLEPLCNEAQHPSNWRMTSVGETVDRLIRARLRLRPHMFPGSQSVIHYTAHTIQLAPFGSRDELQSRSVAHYDQTMLDILSQAYWLPERLFGHSYKLRLALMSDNPVSVTAPAASR